MNRKYWTLFIATALILAACSSFPSQAGTGSNPAPRRSLNDRLSPTGFYYPTGTQPFFYARWLASGCDGKSEYSSGTYHTGLDIRANLGDPVYAIAAGYVIELSDKPTSGWGNTGGVYNKGVLIKHHLKDGSSFVAIYGHLQTAIQLHSYVQAGEVIGTIGDWSPTHLHLTIAPGETARAPYGIMQCPASGNRLDPNGTVDPWVWLTSQYPGAYPDPGKPGGSATPTAAPALPTVAPVIPTPTLDLPQLDQADIGMWQPLTILYDPGLWVAVANSRNITSNPAVHADVVLKHRFLNGCILSQHDFRDGELDDPIVENVQIGGRSLYRTTYHLNALMGGGISVFSYTEDAAGKKFQTRIDLEAGDSPSECKKAGEQLIASSIATLFLP
jgi:murein DD-endopeptidase MepM/ murein hydrolase activator NlpD